MRRRWLRVFATVLAFAVATPVAQDAAPPRLVVIVVVDQFRAGYLETFKHRWQDGFRTLLVEGAWFERAEYPYMNTVTCAGHATIATGTLPRTHGIVLNGWWDREQRVVTACTADPGAPHISYGLPARSGNSGRHLRVNTFADELRAQKPGARVVSLSLKETSAIGLAGHGGDVVTWFDDGSGSFVTSRAFASEPVKAVSDFLTRDPHDAENGRTWALLDRPDTYRFADANPGARPPQTWSGLFPHAVVGRNGADAVFHDLWQATPLSDAYMGRMAASLIDTLALGQRDQTDFLGISFSALDLVGHAFGPESREVEDLLARLDGTLGALIKQLDAKVGRDAYTLALSADHGVAPIPVPGKYGRIVTDEVRERVEETLDLRFGMREAPYVDSVVFNYVYLAPGIFDRLRASDADMRAVEAAVRSLSGVERVLRSDRVSEMGSDPVERAVALSHVPGRSGDLIVVPQPYWFLAPRTSTAGTTHGSSRPYDRHVPILLLGSGIKAGRYEQAATPADIAPTLADLADVRLPRAEGRVLKEALR